MYGIKRIGVILLILLITAGLCGCGRGADGGKEDSVKIVCTFFPIYDWVKNITAEMEPQRAENLFGKDYNGRTTDIELILLYDNGTDLHSYQATASDLVDIATCDLLIYVGGPSDEWIEDALRNSSNPDQKVLCLTEKEKPATGTMKKTMTNTSGSPLQTQSYSVRRYSKR